jgi:hypothetical protein
MFDWLIYRTGIMRFVQRRIHDRNRHLVTPATLTRWRAVANPWHSGRLAAWTLGWPSNGEGALDALKRIRLRG